MVKAANQVGAGDLKDTVRFEKHGTTADEYGNPDSGAFSAQVTRRAYVAPMRGGETVIAERMQGLRPTIIMVRFDDETKLITPSWRAVLVKPEGGEEIYAIKDAQDIDNDRRWITVIAERGSPE